MKQIVRSRRRDRGFIGVDATPMADVVFLLLIFFMLASAFVFQPGLSIRLPKAMTATGESAQKSIVTITTQHKIFVGDKQVSLNELPAILHAEMAQKENRVVIVKADKSVPHGLVVEVMDIAQYAGAEKLVVATEPHVR